MTLTGKEVCLIIREAAQSKVLHLRYGELELKFAPTPYWEEVSEVSQSVEEPSDLSTEQKKELAEASKARDEEDELLRLQLEDPAEYERIISLRVTDA